MTINYIKVLATAKQTISNEIYNKRNNFIKQIVDNNPVMKQRATYKDKIKKLNDQVKKIEQEISLIGTPQEKGSLTAMRNIENGIPYSLLGTYVTSLPNEVAEDIQKQMDTPVFKNIEAFRDICGRFDRMMSMAAGTKEQRGILMQFYSLGWKSLGIDVPANMDITNIAIKDGVIISDTKTLAAPKK